MLSYSVSTNFCLELIESYARDVFIYLKSGGKRKGEENKLKLARLEITLKLKNC